MIKVVVPNKNYNERYFGVEFKNGEAIFQDAEQGRRIAQRLGYEVIELEEQETEKPADAPKKAPARRKATTKKVEA